MKFTNLYSMKISEWSFTERPTSIQPEIQQTIANLLHFTVSSTLVTNRYTYNAWGRQTAAVDGRGNTTTTEHNALGQITGTENAASNRTTYAYDVLGRQTAVTDPLTNTTYTAYDGMNNIIAQWGAVYPVAYEYDTQGRMTVLYTYRGTNEINNQSEILNLKSKMDCTRWHYDAVTGLLNQKLYADGKGTSYTYTPQGRLATRTWARGITTSYAYDALGQLTNTSYSDDTPDITHSYDRLGREIVTWSDNSKTKYAYNSLDLLSETTIDLVTGATNILDRPSDLLGRASGITLNFDYSAKYGFDTENRLVVVSNNVFTANYTYCDANWDTGYKLTLTNGTVINRSITEREHAILGVSWVFCSL